MNETLMKGLLIGVIVGAIAAIGLTIGTGVAVMKSEADAIATSAVQNALVDGYADICVEQFENAPDRDEQLRTLGATPIYSRRDFIARRGFATMPGADSPYRHTADECAARLTQLHELPR